MHELGSSRPFIDADYLLMPFMPSDLYLFNLFNLFNLR